MLSIGMNAVSDGAGLGFGGANSMTPGTAGFNPIAPASIGGIDLGATADVTATAPFADLFTEAIGQVGRLEKQARATVEGLISGKGVDVHQAMIATEKAEMGFEMVLSVRNKALAAYQQVMGMQF